MQNNAVSASYWKTLIQEWRFHLSQKSFRWKIMIMPGLFLLYSAITQKLSNFIETRRGVRLNDKLLEIFPAQDFSSSIFFLLYCSLFALIITHLHKPKVILRLIEMHFLVAVVRQVCILLIALEPPIGIIVLRDVFLENTVYPHDAPLTKDLFFSGHVASLWIYFLCAQHKFLKIYFFVGTLMMSFMVMSMRIHYSYDVMGALAFTSIIFFAPTHFKPFYSKLKAQLSYNKQ